MVIDHILDAELILVGLDASGVEDAIRKLGRLLLEKGCVKDAFIDGVLNREKEFPTGLPTKPVGVALPHTDPEHVNQTRIAIGTLAAPLEFRAMGTREGTVAVRIIFLMALKEEDERVAMLQQLAELLSNPEVVEKLGAARNADEIVGLLHARFAGEEEKLTQT
jgi:PTS system galactitol-specific IIA component